MDPIREHIDPEDPLRSLFRESGHLTAPAGLEARVLGQLTAITAPLQRQAPLINAWGWILAAALVVLIITAGWQAGPPVPGIVGRLPDFSAEPLFQACLQFITSPWLVAMVAAITVVSVIERVLSPRPSRIAVQ